MAIEVYTVAALAIPKFYAFCNAVQCIANLIGLKMYDAIRARLGEGGVSLQMVPHVEFKEMTKAARACVRSGEFTSYANVILVAGVVYGASAAK